MTLRIALLHHAPLAPNLPVPHFPAKIGKHVQNTACRSDCRNHGERNPRGPVMRLRKWR